MYINTCIFTLSHDMFNHDFTPVYIGVPYSDAFMTIHLILIRGVFVNLNCNFQTA